MKQPIVCLILCAVILLSGCGKQSTAQLSGSVRMAAGSMLYAENTAPTAAMTDGDFPASWVSSDSRHYALSLIGTAEEITVRIVWGSKPTEQMVWEFSGTVQDNLLQYSNCRMYLHASADPDQAETSYENGEGLLYLAEDGSLHWEDLGYPASRGLSFRPEGN